MAPRPVPCSIEPDPARRLDALGRASGGKPAQGGEARLATKILDSCDDAWEPGGDGWEEGGRLRQAKAPVAPYGGRRAVGGLYSDIGG